MASTAPAAAVPSKCAELSWVSRIIQIACARPQQHQPSTSNMAGLNVCASTAAMPSTPIKQAPINTTACPHANQLLQQRTAGCWGDTTHLPTQQPLHLGPHEPWQPRWHCWCWRITCSQDTPLHPSALASSRSSSDAVTRTARWRGSWSRSAGARNDVKGRSQHTGMLG